MAECCCDGGQKDGNSPAAASALMRVCPLAAAAERLSSALRASPPGRLSQEPAPPHNSPFTPVAPRMPRSVCGGGTCPPTHIGALWVVAAPLRSALGQPIRARCRRHRHSHLSAPERVSPLKKVRVTACHCRCGNRQRGHARGCPTDKRCCHPLAPRSRLSLPLGGRARGRAGDGRRVRSRTTFSQPHEAGCSRSERAVSPAAHRDCGLF